MMINHLSVENYAMVASALFIIGMSGMFIQKQSIIGILMSIELMLLSTVILFSSASNYWQDVNGYIFVIFILTVAAAETAIGLAILIAHYREKMNVDVESIEKMGG